MKKFIYCFSVLFLCLMACEETTTDDEELVVEEEEEVEIIFPNYSFSSLEEGTEVWNQITIDFTAENDEQLLNTILYVNGDSVLSVASSERSIIWNSKDYEDGDVTLALGAELETGEKGELRSLDLIVKNIFLTVEAFASFMSNRTHYIIISDLEGNLIMDSVVSGAGSYKFVRPDDFNEEAFHVYDVERLESDPQGQFYTQVYCSYPFDRLNLKNYISSPGFYSGDFYVRFEGDPPINTNGIFPLYTGFGYANYSINQFWYENTTMHPFYDYSSAGYNNYHFLTFEDEGIIKALVGDNYLPEDTVILNFDEAFILDRELVLNIPASSDFFRARVYGYQDDNFYDYNFIDYSSTDLNPQKEALHHADFGNLFSHYEIYRYFQNLNEGKGYFNRNKVQSIPTAFEQVQGDANLINSSLANFEFSASENFDFANTRFQVLSETYFSEFAIFNNMNTSNFKLVELEIEAIPISFRDAVPQWENMQHSFTDVVEYTNPDLEYVDYVAFYALREVLDLRVFDFNGISLFQSNTSARNKSSSFGGRFPDRDPLSLPTVK